MGSVGRRTAGEVSGAPGPPGPRAAAVHGDSHAAGNDEEDEGEAEEDLEPVGGGPVVPGLGVDPDLADEGVGECEAVLTGEGEGEVPVLRLLPGQPGALRTVGLLRLRQHREDLRVSDVLRGSEPDPGPGPEADAGGEDGLAGLEVGLGQAGGQHGGLAIVVDTHQMSIRVRTPSKDNVRGLWKVMSYFWLAVTQSPAVWCLW